MESFGLFHFLQTLLSQNGESTPQEPPKPSAQDPAPAPQNNSAPPEPISPITSSQEAAIDFLSRHEARAKRLKKK